MYLILSKLRSGLEKFSVMVAGNRLIGWAVFGTDGLEIAHFKHSCRVRSALLERTLVHRNGSSCESE